MRVWNSINKDHLQQWKKKSTHVHYDAMRRRAKVKGIPWDDETFPKEVAKEMMTKPCEYCGLASDGTFVNGNDRMNNNHHYTLSSCVTCCKSCNFIKKCLDPTTFIDRCLHISALHGGSLGRLNRDAWPSEMRTNMVSTQSYMIRAEDKALPFEIQVESFSLLREEPCHHCHHVEEMNGVDRKDNTCGYTAANCVVCCKECNHMKAQMSDTDFIASCIRVAEFEGRTRDYSSIPQTMKAITRRSLPSKAHG